MYKEREKLFYGGPVLTMDEACMRPEAVLVRGERIAAVGLSLIHISEPTRRS